MKTQGEWEVIFHRVTLPLGDSSTPMLHLVRKTAKLSRNVCLRKEIHRCTYTF